jgi:sigma-B regulation protein RsbU (phosphoserine phosphatase)
MKTPSTVGARSQTDSTDRFDLGALFEFSSNVNSSLDVNFILNHFLLTVMGKMMSPRGVVLLAGKSGAFAVSTVKGLPDSLLGTTLHIRRPPSSIVSSRRASQRSSPWMKFFKESQLAFIVPLESRGKVLGLLGFASLVPKKTLSGREETYVRALGNIAAAAIEKGLVLEEVRQVNRRLDAKVQELNTLFDLSKEFNSVLEAEKLLKLLTFSLLGQVGTNRFFTALRSEGKMDIVQSRVEGAVSPSIVKFCADLTKPVFVHSISKGKKAAIATELNALGIQLLVPIHLHDETAGVIAVGERVSRLPYSEADIEFLSSLGNLAMISLENAHLFREAIEKQKLEDELVIAKEIQSRLLPGTLPAIPGYEISAMNVTSKQVGGDYYDVLVLDDGRNVIAIGDVSGKGTPASLLMANIQATIRALAPFGLPLSDLTARVNNIIVENTGSDRFITFFWGTLDSSAGVFEYVNAGHNPPYLFHADGSFDRLEKGGIILGVMKTIVPYEMGTIRFAPGDTLLLFTDGVSEAMSKSDEEYGEERLERSARASLAHTPAQIIENLVASVREHAAGTIQSDFITLVAVKRLP